jgi:hypothetical protein
MNEEEPPSQARSQSSPLLVGRDRRGHWVVRSLNGLCGGLFVNRAEAMRFALFENGHHRDGVIMVNGVLELNLSDPRAGVSRPGAAAEARNNSRERRTEKQNIGLARLAPALA